MQDVALVLAMAQLRRLAAIALSLICLIAIMAVAMAAKVLPSTVQILLFIATVGLTVAVVSLCVMMPTYYRDMIRARDPPRTDKDHMCDCALAMCPYGSLGSSRLDFRRLSVREGVASLSSRISLNVAPIGLCSQGTCICCLEDFQHDSKVAVAMCGHVFHEDCLMKWLYARPGTRLCPTCRAPLSGSASTTTSTSMRSFPSNTSSVDDVTVEDDVPDETPRLSI
mmetsp:Transcript_3494/g.8218  ORF Transcript_3494/g.8218 Transcript_3494/m.8218 type:complete len:225 (+) Transcript_3494:22-696(+)